MASLRTAADRSEWRQNYKGWLLLLIATEMEPPAASPPQRLPLIPLPQYCHCHCHSLPHPAPLARCHYVCSSSPPAPAPPAACIRSNTAIASLRIASSRAITAAFPPFAILPPAPPLSPVLFAAVPSPPLPVPAPAASSTTCSCTTIDCKVARNLPGLTPSGWLAWNAVCGFCFGAAPSQSRSNAAARSPTRRSGSLTATSSFKKAAQRCGTFDRTGSMGCSAPALKRASSRNS
ncbi:hypothetical protein Vafri_21757, partial [Volvox africanus]